jgi:hypothetical protein
MSAQEDTAICKQVIKGGWLPIRMQKWHLGPRGSDAAVLRLRRIRSGVFGPEAGTRAAEIPHESADELACVSMLKRRPSLDDVANAAAFLASGWASTMTSTEVNLTGGAVVD